MRAYPMGGARMEKDLARRIGERSRLARKSLALTQAEVAERVGLATEVYGRLERGAMLPSVTTVVALADALNVTPGRLLGEGEPHQARNPRERPELRRIVGLLERADTHTLRRALVVVKAVLPPRRGR